MGLMMIPTNTPLLCKFNGDDGQHAGYIVATYKMGRFYANNGLFPINRVTGWRLIEDEGFNAL